MGSDNQYQKNKQDLVLNILQTHHAVSKKGTRKLIALSENAKNCLKKKTIGRFFFRRLRGNLPKLKIKYKNKVSTNLNCGMRCTHEMTTEHLDELGGMLIETGIAPDLKKIEPGVCSGKTDTERIWAFQFIN